MKKEQFRPGPWRVSTNNDGKIYSDQVRGALIAHCFKKDYANLIAAAPDMYEALSKARTFFELWCLETRGNYVHDHLWIEMTAALDKANPQ
jgi:hypothetical protein